MTKAFLGTGQVLNLFQFTRTGKSYFKRNKLQTLMLKIVKAAWEAMKLEVMAFMNTYWPEDTGAFIRSAKKWVRRSHVRNLEELPNLTIGSDVDYAGWVLSMAERMAARGKSVNWSKSMTKEIERDILGETVKLAQRMFKAYLDIALDTMNLGWMFGRGKPPKSTIIETESGRTRKIPRYRGKHKPIKVY